MVDIEAAATYPMESDDVVEIVLIGGVLLLFSWLVVPALLAYGYVISAIQSRYEGEAAPPSFEDWETLLVDGAKAVAIGLVYMVVPLLVGIITIGGAILAAVSGGRAGGAAAFGGIVTGFLLTTVLALVFGYIAAAGVLNFAHEGSIRAGFDFDRITTLATSGDYIVAWAATIGVSIVISVVSGALGFVPILGQIASVFVAFYGQLVMAYLWADGYTATFDVAPESATRTVADTP